MEFVPTTATIPTSNAIQHSTLGTDFEHAKQRAVRSILMIAVQAVRSNFFFHSDAFGPGTISVKPIRPISTLQKMYLHPPAKLNTSCILWIISWKIPHVLASMSKLDNHSYWCARFQFLETYVQMCSTQLIYSL